MCTHTALHVGGSASTNKAIKSKELTVLLENLEAFPWFEYGKGQKTDQRRTNTSYGLIAALHTHTQKNTNTPHLPFQPDQDCLILYR